MKLPGSRTTAKLIYSAKSFVFDKGNFQAMIDLREKHDLEDAMGFRGQFDNHRIFQIRMLKQQGLQPQHRFLELGCGPLTAAIPVIDYINAGNYFGVDIRSPVLDMGWREIGKHHLSSKNPHLICSNSFGDDELRPDEKFDFIFSFSVLYHLSDDILNAYFAAVARRLSATGICLANVNTTIPSDKWLEFPFLRRGLDDYAAVAAKHGLKTDNLGQIKDLGFRSTWGERENPLLRFRL
jgi:SAM-dependent methyltransferase